MSESVLLRKKTRIVEVIASTGFSAPQIKLPTEYDLNGVQILALEIFTSEMTPISPLGNAVMTYAQVQGLYLTLYTNDPDIQKIDPVTGTVISTDEGQYLYQVPAVSLISMNFNSTASLKPFAPGIFRMFGQAIQWGKSYIDVKQALGNNAAPVSLLLQVTYQGQSRG